MALDFIVIKKIVIKHALETYLRFTKCIGINGWVFLVCFFYISIDITCTSFLYIYFRKKKNIYIWYRIKISLSMDLAVIRIKLHFHPSPNSLMRNHIQNRHFWYYSYLILLIYKHTVLWLVSPAALATVTCNTSLIGLGAKRFYDLSDIAPG